MLDPQTLWLLPVALMMPPPFSATTGIVFWIDNTTSNFKETSGVSTTNWSTGASTITTSTSAYTNFCYDRKNSQLYVATLSDIRKWAPGATSGGTSVVSLSNTLTGIDVDPTNALLFYTTNAGEVRKCTTSGSGDTQLVSWSDARTGQGAVAYDKTTDRVYYVKNTAPGGTATTEIRYISPDGTGDTSVYNVPGSFDPAVRSLAIDVTNRILFWSEFYNDGSFDRFRVKSSAMDGSGVATIYAPSTTSTTLPILCFSQSQSKIYIRFDGVGGGTRRMNGDGSSVDTVASVVTTTPALAVGDGLETIGGGAIL